MTKMDFIIAEIDEKMRKLHLSRRKARAESRACINLDPLRKYSLEGCIGLWYFNYSFSPADKKNYHFLPWLE